MPSDPPQPHLVDSLKASASKLKEMQSALDARAKELDALRTHLAAERAELERRAEALRAEREAVDREREEVRTTRSSMDADLAAINADRETLTKEDERLRELSAAVGDREKAVQLDEARLHRLEQGLAAHLTESESGLRGLLEREEELVKAQTAWLGVFEARQKELRTISEAMQATQAEADQRYAAFTALRDAVQDQITRLLAENEKLALKEKSILEAERYLSSTFNVDMSEAKEEVAPTPPPPPPEAPPEPPQAPPTPPEPVPAIAQQEETPVEETPAKPAATKSEAMERLAQAVDAWKRARAAGWKVSDIRENVKSAREAVAAGDYETALRVATEILEALQATATTR